MDQKNLTIVDLFEEIVAKFPQKTALQIKRNGVWQRLSYQELKFEVLKVAAFLKKEGVKRGDFIILFLENRLDWPKIYLGIMYVGAVCVPLDYQSSPEELKTLISDCKARILFCSQELFNKKITPDIKELLNRIVIIDSDEFQIEKIFFEEIPVFIEPDDPASLIYTSGTTDIPKGVLLTHRNFCSNFFSIAKLNLYSPADNFLAILPLHHTYPFMATFLVPLLYGATVTFAPLAFKPEALTDIVREAKVTILVGVPQLFSLIHATISEKIKKIPVFLEFLFLPFLRRRLRHNFGKNLKFLISGGARLEPEIAKDLTRWGLKIIEGYGLSETSPVVTLNPPQKVKFGSVGKALPDVEIKIFNPDNKGEGEILIKGPNVMKGYFKEEELTASVIKDGWFHSGDLGYIDKDGYLFITGRKKEIIVLSSGKNIYPEELEKYYSRSPYIKEICILPKRETSFGTAVDSLYAVIVPDLDYFKQRGEANIHGKIRWELETLARNLPPHKHIMGFILTREELPRTTLKKIQRYKVKEKYLELRSSQLDIEEPVFSEEDVRILNHEIAKKIIDYISGQLKKPVYLHSHLEIDLGIDSLTRVELGLGLEALLSVRITDEVLYTVSTVKDVIIKVLEIMDKESVQAIKALKTWNQILKEEPRKEIKERIKLEIGFIDFLLTFIFKNTFLLILRIFWFLRISGRENIPKEGPFLICPNHASYLDGFIVFSSLPLEIALKTYFVGYAAIFEHPLVRWAIKSARLIPIDPTVQLTDAMQAVSYVLSYKKIVCIFPEGERSIDVDIGEFKKGIGILIKELDIPVLPVYIKGSHYSWPRGKHLPRFHPLKIIFGEPQTAKKLLVKERQIGQDDYEVIAQALREEVIKLA